MPRESFDTSNQPRIYISPFKQEQDIKVISSQGTVMQTGQAMKRPGNQHHAISSHWQEVPLCGHQGGSIQFLSLSSVESEYVAASQCVAEGIWLTRLANKVGLYNPEPLIIYSDSTGATNLAKNPVQHQRTKHVDIRYHFIRQKVSSGEVIML